jgi:CheY-like chemotaxis protein
MSGGEFLSVLRSTHDRKDRPPVVVVSAWPKEAAQLRDQAQGFVKKPVSLEALLDVAREYCGSGRDQLF